MGNTNNKQEISHVSRTQSDETTFPLNISFPELDLPYDDEGYVQSFTVDQVEEYKLFFDQYGFVVIDQAISKEDNERTIDQLWTLLETKEWQMFNDDRVDRNVPMSWGLFPKSPKGIIGSEVAVTEMAFRNRENEDVYGVFREIMGREDLWVSLDRFGVMRPTVGVSVEELDEVVCRVDAVKEGSKTRDFDEWRTDALWLHWDLNPWIWKLQDVEEEYQFYGLIVDNSATIKRDEIKFQGLLNLIDSREEDGGFCTVPGFHQHLQQWCTMSKGTAFCKKKQQNHEFVHVPTNDPMNQQVKKITSRAGSLIIWNSEMPHCNYPNTSNRFRMNQYIKAFPARENATGVDFRKMHIEMEVKKAKDYIPSDLGRKLLGLDSWYKDTPSGDD